MKSNQNKTRVKTPQILELMGERELSELREIAKLLHEQNLRRFISWLKYSCFFEV